MDTQRIFLHARRTGALVLALAAFFGNAPTLYSQAALDEGALSALSAYAGRDYGAALGLYRALSEGQPSDATYPFMMAKCYNRLGQPNEALAAIDHAVANGAQFLSIEYERGRAWFLLGEDVKALAAYEAYHQKTPGDAISNQFHAEALEAAGRHQEALDRLKKVKPPKQLEFRQEVLTAVAEAGVNRAQDALVRLDRLAAQPLDLETRKFLFALRTQIESRSLGVALGVTEAPAAERPTRRPWNLALSLGGEYDTNIPSHGEEPRIRRKGLEELDGPRMYAALDASYRYEVSDRFAVTANLEAYGNRNFADFSEFDIHYVQAGLTPEYRLWKRNIFVGLEGWYARTWVNSAGFENEIGMKPYATIVYSPYAATKVSLGWRWEEFDASNELNPREDQDGRELRLEIAQEVLVKGTDLILRLGFYHEHESREGDDLDQERQGTFFGFRYQLPYDVYLSGRLDYSAGHFSKENSRLLLRESPGERSDEDLIWSVQLSRQIVEGLDLTLYHTGYDEESNVNEYDFDRNIWGGSLTYRF